MQTPRRLRGMEDRGPDAARLMARAGDTLRAFLASYGYQQIDTPLLEETELLLRKSGGELASKMYTFTDPGGHRVSLRPEFTSSLVRAYLNGINYGKLPVRWSYSGPVFRYEPEDVEYRQFTQVGAEIIGAAGTWADAEVMAMACKGLSHLGITGHQLVVGHLGFIGALLDSLGLSDRARLFLLASVATLSSSADGAQQVRQRAEEMGLLSTHAGEEETEDAVSSEAALALLERYAQTSASSTIGVRTPQEIRERFMRKQRYARDSGSFDRALDLLSRVVQVRSEPQAALKDIRRIVGSSQARGLVDDLATTLDALSQYQVGVPVSVEFGLARGIAYYTGAVFDIRHPSARDASIGGGGRYDGLVQALGGPGPTPAMGFAWSLERVTGVMAAGRGPSTVTGPQSDVLLLRPDSASAMTAALKEAERLRAQGKMVQLEVNGRSLQECLVYSREQGMGHVLTVEVDGEVKRRNVPGR